MVRTQELSGMSSRQPFMHTQPRHGEGGYMMIASLLIVMIAISVLGSFAFVANRDNHFKSNFVVGQRLAELARNAHLYAQNLYYATNPPSISLDGAVLPLAAMTPDDFALPQVGGTRFTIEVLGRDAAPINSDTDPATKAGSAYLHLGIRSSGPRPPSDLIALLAGAASRNMSRAGIVDPSIPASDICDGIAGNTVVRWGPEASACLTNAHLGALGFSDVRPGDIIVPAWETALATGKSDRLYRFPQPGRPDLNMMLTRLTMTDNAGLVSGIRNIGAANAQEINASAGRTVISEVVTRPGKTANFTQAVTANTLKVDDTASGMVVTAGSGTIQFNTSNNNSTLNIAGKLSRPNPAAPGSLDINAQNTVRTNILGDTGLDMQLSPVPVPVNAPSNTMTASVKNMTTPISQIKVLKPNGHLAVVGALGTGANGEAQLMPDPLTGKAYVYTAQMTTESTGNTVAKGPTLAKPNPDWTIGGINQTGTMGGQGLGAENFTFNECTGSACPTQLTDPADGGL
ncbi:MAG: Bacterial shufflon protein N-terminal constant region [Alphaproteobacteria bacterium]|nr:Bacterial shufflon protein N-terminal constant region [Alphaproteobacteria bacterium]